MRVDDPTHFDNAPAASAVSRQSRGTCSPSLGCSPARRSEFRNIELISLAPKLPIGTSEKSTT
jgi:hypothetical protein